MSKPLVSIIMGSDSDLAVMREAALVLEEFEVPYELTVISAHRTPAKIYSYGAEAAARGLEVIIAGAGGAAHLAGVTAALTELPVIGVPILGKALQGADALYAIVQMPAGIPVATVAINGAKNAGLLAIQILGVKNPVYREKIKKYRQGLKEQVEEKAAKLEKQGFKAYLEEM